MSATKFYTVSISAVEAYYITTTTTALALAAITTPLPGKVISFSTEELADQTLVDLTKFAHFRIQAISKAIYIVSGSDATDANTRFKTAFASEEAQTLKQLVYSWAYYNVTPTPPPPGPQPTPGRLFGLGTHFGQNNNVDYNTGNMDLGISIAQFLGHNAIKTDISMNTSGVPSTTDYAAFKAKVQTAGTFKFWGIITGRGSASNQMPAPANGSTYTTAELNTAFNRGYGTTNPFVIANPNTFYAIEVGNEMCEGQTLTGGGTSGFIKSGQTGTAWNSTNYDLEKYKIFFAEYFGMHKGIKDADPTIKVGINYTWTHYAFPKQFQVDAKAPSMLTDSKATALKLDFCANHWYSDMEYATLPGGQKAANQASSILITNLSSSYGMLGFSEWGLRSDVNPNGLSKAAYHTLMINQYWFNNTNKIDFMVGLYELFLEPGRGTGVESKFGIQDGTKANLPANYSSDVNALSTINLFP